MYEHTGAGIKPSTLRKYIFVKKGNYSDRIKLRVEGDGKVKRIDTPDKRIWVTSNPDFFPDKYCFRHACSPYQSGSIASKHIKSVLFSAATATVSEPRSKWCSNSDLTVMGDNGGYQLGSGTMSHVNLNGLISTINNGIDVSCVLDIPPSQVDSQHPKVMQILANQQKFSLDVMKGRVQPSVKMLNVVHGFNFDQFREWAKIVDDPYCAGWAIGVEHENPFRALQTILLLNQEFPQSNRHYHLFGIGNSDLVPALAWLSVRLGVSMGSDSSRHIFTSNSRVMDLYLPDGRIQPFRITDQATLVECHRQSKRPDKRLSPAVSKVIEELTEMNTISCNCEICYSLGYLKVLNYFPDLIGLHNLIHRTRNMSWWSRMARQLDHNTYLKVVHRITQGRWEPFYYTEFAELAICEGLDAACDRYAYLDDESDSKQEHQTLIPPSDYSVGSSWSSMRPYIANTLHWLRRIEVDEPPDPDLITSNAIRVLPNYLTHERMMEIGLSVPLVTYWRARVWAEAQRRNLIHKKGIKQKDMTWADVEQRCSYIYHR